MTVLKQFSLLISTIGLIFVLIANSHSAESVGLDSAKKYSKDLTKLMMSGKKNKTLIVNALNKIDEECCSEAFKEKNKILKIKESLNNCLDNKCHNNTYLMWVIKRPQKLIVLNQIEELDNLLLSNEKASLLDTKKREDILAEEKKAAEGNYKKLLVTYEKLNKDHKDLKLKVEKLLAKYESQISKLENENKEINEKNNEMYSLLNNFQKRKLEKKNK
jgi:hypothetical protein